MLWKLRMQGLVGGEQRGGQRVAVMPPAKGGGSSPVFTQASPAVPPQQAQTSADNVVDKEITPGRSPGGLFMPLAQVRAFPSSPQSDDALERIRRELNHHLWSWKVTFQREAPALSREGRRQFAIHK